MPKKRYEKFLKFYKKKATQKYILNEIFEQIPKTLMESRISLFNYNYKERKQMKLKRHISEISQGNGMGILRKIETE